MSGCKSVFVIYNYISKHICFLSCNIQVEEAGALLVLIMEGMGAAMEGGSRDPYWTTLSFISFGECVINYKCYLIQRILSPRKVKV